MELQLINRQRLRKIIKRLKGGKASGVDNIDSFSLKVAAPLLEDALEHLINLSINSSTFSTLWKPQLIFPLHKKSDKSLIENYRPVSHLVEIGNQVLRHFLDNSLFHENHHGGLPDHSTTTALIQLNDMLLEAAHYKNLQLLFF